MQGDPPLLEEDPEGVYTDTVRRFLESQRRGGRTCRELGAGLLTSDQT
jgi:hypothetical protein